MVDKSLYEIMVEHVKSRATEIAVEEVHVNMLFMAIDGQIVATALLGRHPYDLAKPILEAAKLDIDAYVIITEARMQIGDMGTAKLFHEGDIVNNPENPEILFVSACAKGQAPQVWVAEIKGELPHRAVREWWLLPEGEGRMVFQI